jgi:hypothetical protein
VTGICPVYDGPDTFLVTSSLDRSVCVWNVAVGSLWVDPLRAGFLRKGHTDGVTAVCPVPVDGHMLIASTSLDTTIQLWDPIRGKPVGPPYTAHTNPVLAVCAVPVGSRVLLATVGEDGIIQIWDPSSGDLVARLAAHSDAVGDLCAFTAEDNLLLASAGDDGTVSLWGPANAPDNPRPRTIYGTGTEAVDLREGTALSRHMEAEMDHQNGRAHLRGDIVPWLEVYGRHIADTQHSDMDAELAPTIAAMYYIAEDDPQAFIARLRTIARSAGGWTAYGAHKLVCDILDDFTNDDYLEIFEQAMGFAKAQRLDLTEDERAKIAKYTPSLNNPH